MRQANEKAIKQISSMIDSGYEVFNIQAIMDIVQGLNLVETVEGGYALQSIANSLVAITLLLKDMKEDRERILLLLPRIETLIENHISY